jgi:hypothetical protein
MIEIFVGLIVLLLLPDEREEKTDPEEYYPYMYDHFNSDNDGDWDWDD